MKHAIKQRGFTLIELLVVVAIMGVFMGLVAISNRPSRKTQLRQAAQSVASLVIAAQSNALESDVGSALWISAEGVYDANPQQNDHRTLASVSNVTATTYQLNGLTVPLDAYRVRFVSNTSDTQPPSPWFNINVNTRIASFQSPAQTPLNTIWPARFYSDPSNPQCNAEFDLRPLKTGLAYQWPKLAKIDWRYSGIGDSAPLATDAVIAFDASGKIETFFTALSDVPAMSTLYLCIAYAPDVGEDANLNGVLDTEDLNNNGLLDTGEDLNGNNILDFEDANGNGVLDHGRVALNSEDTVWVAIEPNTGRASLGWNLPPNPPLSPATVTPTSAQLQAARANVIAGRGLAN